MTYYLERLGLAHDRAWTAYEPKPYPGKVIQFYAKRQPLGIHPDPTLGWGGLPTGDFQVKEVPGFRQNMLDEPYVEVLAAELMDALHASENIECESLANAHNISPEQVRCLILAHLQVPLSQKSLKPEEIRDDFDLLNEGIVDSLGILELVSEVEERFSMEIDFDEMDPEKLTVIGPFCRYVSEKCSGWPHSEQNG